MILCAGQTWIDCIVTDHGREEVAEDISLTGVKIAICPPVNTCKRNSPSGLFFV